MNRLKVVTRTESGNREKFQSRCSAFRGVAIADPIQLGLQRHFSRTIPLATVKAKNSISIHHQ